MKTKEQFKIYLLKYYKERLNNIKNVESLKVKTKYYTSIIKNYDLLFEDKLKEVIDKRLQDIFTNIEYKNLSVKDAIKLVDSGLDSLGLIDKNTEIVSLFESYRHILSFETKTKIINTVYSNFGIPLIKEKKYIKK